ncbi:MULTISPECIES: TIGR04211 family SH3 domain-containing protein [Pseudoalteromonas]|uniref:TIGR04211 family SH3 domain-containing protein n=1 Tax=Pseudoalteromonas TaxID=53246 RepID=UPI000CA32E3F|nr:MULTISPECIES: TIGR04211 family SH3 domain-containing protein [Pseudoalteromonas]AUJ71087.1 SH3 domain-containing protein [Pseudoalteromonas sp. NC201]MCF2828184.1 TIGR04211 family SH3 domain-containing protein [Pseudoalteromonas sp. OF5H-5]MCF2832469.1 TIGR04211 family SH3 domain-containing protein [Pseudoalteromonas sp. DL2-H6]MCF2924272.1 TIGR04211 family SH3 domain-containing protein [Pseudoalteromonas sp. DL2-H1]MCF7512146.1 TIGR04211 family SH3 domain-containing protein [Pseudoalteromo
MFNFKQFIIASLLFTSFISFAEEPDENSTVNTATPNGYISDNLFIFMHTGPSKNYRILGSVDAGTPITILSGANDEFVQIKDDKAREGWVESKFVTTEPGLKQQLEAVNQTLVETQEALNDAQQQLPMLQQNNTNLLAENASLQDTISGLEKQLQDERLAQQQKVQKEQHQLLTYGGIIGISGIIIGVILTLFLSRRKRYDGW